MKPKPKLKPVPHYIEPLPEELYGVVDAELSSFLRARRVKVWREYHPDMPPPCEAGTEPMKNGNSLEGSGGEAI